MNMTESEELECTTKSHNLFCCQHSREHLGTKDTSCWTFGRWLSLFLSLQDSSCLTFSDPSLSCFSFHDAPKFGLVPHAERSLDSLNLWYYVLQMKTHSKSLQFQGERYFFWNCATGLKCSALQVCEPLPTFASEKLCLSKMLLK